MAFLTDEDEEDLPLSPEEEEQKKRNANSIVPDDAMEPASKAKLAPESVASGYEPPKSIVGDSGIPQTAAKPTSVTASTLGGSDQPLTPRATPQPGPMQQRYEQLAANPPQLHGAKKVADVIGQMIGSRFESKIPGSMGYYQNELGNAQKAAGLEGQQAEQSARTNLLTTQAEEAAEKIRQQKEDNQLLGKVVNGKMWNPATRTYDIDIGANIFKKPQEGYANAVQHAIAQGTDPAKDKTVQFWADAITSTQHEPVDTKMDTRIIGGVPHSVLINGKTGETIKDLGQTKIPGESPDVKRNAAESAQVERESRQAVRKAENEYRGAEATSNMQRQFIAEAKGGNKAAVKIVPLEGALEITTSQGVHRINRTEVEQYGGAGSWYDKIVGEIGKGLTGKDIPDNVLNDMDKMTQEVQKNAYKKYQNEYNDNKGIVEGYGGKDFDKRVPMIQDPNAGGGGGGVSVSVGGKNYNFPDQKSADAFKKEAGIK